MSYVPPPPPPPPPGMPPPPMGMPYGAPPSLAGVLAPWWKRAVATIIDLIIVGLVSTVIAGQNVQRITENGSTRIRVNGKGIALFLVLWTLYNGILNATRGQTLGKMALGIRVAHVATGAKIAMGPSILRSFVHSIMWQLCGIAGIVDALWPLWDKQKQTLHDKVATSNVYDGKPAT